MNKILLVDDQINVVRVMTLLLERENFEVVGSTECDEALRIISGDREIDLMIIDMKMPGMGGIEVAKKVREWGKAFPILFQTGNLDLTEKESKELEGLGIAESDILRKPVEFSEVLARIKATININSGR